MQPRRILTLGPLIVDIITSSLERLPGSGEGVAASVGIHPGGCSFNVSVDCAHIGGDRFDVTSIGAVGDDIFREFFSRELRKGGVRPELYPVKGESTGANIILQVQGDERRFCTDAGANLHLSPDTVVSVIDKLQPDCFCLGELSLMGPCEAEIGRFCTTAKKYHSMTVADVVCMPGAVWEDLFNVADAIDVFHSNDEEAFDVSGANDIRTALRFFIDRGFRLPVISRGGKGLSWAWNGFYYSLAPFTCTQIDATGAGDAFVGGTVIRLLENGVGGVSGTPLLTVAEPVITEALIFGAASGATAVTAKGCTGAVTREHIEALLDGQATAVRDSLTKTPL